MKFKNYFDDKSAQKLSDRLIELISFFSFQKSEYKENSRELDLIF